MGLGIEMKASERRLAKGEPVCVHDFCSATSGFRSRGSPLFCAFRVGAHEERYIQIQLLNPGVEPVF